MVEFINALGGIMQVAESRVEEYEKLGYKRVPAVEPEKPKAEKPKKSNTKKK